MDNQQQTQTWLAQEKFHELDVRYDSEQRAIWCYVWPTSRPSCTPELLSEILHLLQLIEERVGHGAQNNKQDAPRYLIIASRMPGVFSLGGDLALFLKLIRSGNRDELYQYAKLSIDIAYASYYLPITTIALVQGDAFGGGFEGALASQVLIAERQARMGLPDVLFNFLPVCAYSLLARRLNPAEAERLILSGRTYAAAELYDMGVVDMLAENGHGEEAVRAYMKKQNRANNTYQAMHKVRRAHQPMNYDELAQIAEIWVDTALQLNERDLRIMERLAQSQEKLVVLRPSAEVKQLA
ncbi:MAG: crotonase/enoyl-CoA hydratase family protein [Pseudomonadota bacterium]